MIEGVLKEKAFKECMIKIHPTAVTDDKNELRIIVLTSSLAMPSKVRKDSK
jgi:hypothetical protein